MSRPHEQTQPLYRPQYITFMSVEKEPRIVEVLAGEAAPTASGGYPMWARLKRPQRLSLTILEGYEPFTLTVPILFDSIRRVTDHHVAHQHIAFQEDIELQIQWLEWMANRGIVRYGPKGAPFQPALGKPPLVKVFASDSKERYSPLIPKQFQDQYISWVIEDITWDEHPMRGPFGARRRQAAVVKLLQYVKSEPIPGGGRPGKESYTTHHTTKQNNTLRKVVAQYLVGTRLRLHEAVKATIEANGGNRAVGSHGEKKLKNGTAIRIPNRFLQPP